MDEDLYYKMIDMRLFDMALLQIYTTDIAQGKTLSNTDQYQYKLVCFRLNSYYSDTTFYSYLSNA